MVTSDVGRLQLLEKLAEGGMSEVYLATALQAPDDPGFVAVKRLRHALVMDPAVVRAFAKEAWLGRWLRHPGFVRVLGGGTDAGRPFIVMEYLDGASLRTLSRDRASTPRTSIIEPISSHSVSCWLSSSQASRCERSPSGGCAS